MVKFVGKKAPIVPHTLHYLASPFSNPKPMFELCNYMEIHRVALELQKQGYLLIEPIASSYQKYASLGAGGDANAWKNYNERLMKKCDGIIVAMMPGWDKSKGVAHEIEFAKSCDLLIYYVEV